MQNKKIKNSNIHLYFSGSSAFAEDDEGSIEDEDRLQRITNIGVRI